MGRLICLIAVYREILLKSSWKKNQGANLQNPEYGTAPVPGLFFRASSARRDQGFSPEFFLHPFCACVCCARLTRKASRRKMIRRNADSRCRLAIYTARGAFRPVGFSDSSCLPWHSRMVPFCTSSRLDDPEELLDTSVLPNSLAAHLQAAALSFSQIGRRTSQTHGRTLSLEPGLTAL